MKVDILDDWFDTLRTLACFRKLGNHDVTVWTDHEPDPVELADRVQSAECLVLFRERTRIGADLLDRIPNLKLISQRGSYPHIDVEACNRHGVLLCSEFHFDTPSFSAAELTLALIFASYRQIPEQAASLKAGNWQMGVGRTLRGQRLGLYGYGRIAKAVATYAEALGMNVEWWASDQGRIRARADGAPVAKSREKFFSDNDIISLHVRLTESTKGIVTRKDLASMKHRGLIVNTARSRLFAPGALEEEVAKGRIHAAVDVFDSEPMKDTNNILAVQPNVLATPHIGYVTEDEFNLQFGVIFDQINAFADGNPVNLINPEVWPGLIRATVSPR